MTRSSGKLVPFWFNVSFSNQKEWKGFTALQICSLHFLSFPLLGFHQYSLLHFGHQCPVLLISQLPQFSPQCNKTKPSCTGWLYTNLYPSLSGFLFSQIVFMQLVWGWFALHAWLTWRSHNQVMCSILYDTFFSASQSYSLICIQSSG